MWIDCAALNETRPSSDYINRFYQTNDKNVGRDDKMTKIFKIALGTLTALVGLTLYAGIKEIKTSPDCIGSAYQTYPNVIDLDGDADENKGTLEEVVGDAGCKFVLVNSKYSLPELAELAYGSPVSDETLEAIAGHTFHALDKVYNNYYSRHDQDLAEPSEEMRIVLLPLRTEYLQREPAKVYINNIAESVNSLF
ncbi:hypothetical protein COV20_00500 [Candidatus Woesearchaeota archaeon CG10_big_fil_rev_8_21_14_0_10_45_16]|nr:MAG: hypothetical protein COV20_00500 [Candidatus Woesearchaeota archaeon CG10_big_fil_rev_8_21_14_0_10_45_16]